MKKESINNWFEYIKKNSLKFLSLFVILTLCSAMRYAAIGKYSSFLQDSTQVIAGESFFASNYLQRVESISEITETASNQRVFNNEGNGYYITIGTWNKYDYSIPFEIRNYSNSLKYNKLEEQNTYFYVTADLFLDNECTEPADSLKESLGLTASVVFDTKAGALGKVGTIQFEDDGPEYPVSLLKGGNIYSQPIQVRVQTSGDDRKVDVSELYVRVAAYIIPTENFEKISLTDNANNFKSSTNSVYTQMLGALFCLGSKSATADIKWEDVNDENSLKVVLNVACNDMDVQAEASARIYYNSSKLEYGKEAETKVSVNNAEEIAAREKFMRDNFYEEDMDEDEWNEILAKAENYDKYIQFSIQKANLKEFIFLKTKQDDYNKDYFCFGVVVEEDD